MNDALTERRTRVVVHRRGLVRHTLIVAILSITVLACPPSVLREPEPNPVEVLEAWHEALVEGRVEDAHSLLGGELRQRYSLEKFRALYARQRGAMILQARDVLRRIEQTPVQESAEVRVGNVLTVLVKEGPGWRLTMPVGTNTARQK